jgi:hypothetical protein
LVDDITVFDDAWVLFSDPDKIYVDTSGSDTQGSGSRSNPYRTITHALNVAVDEAIWVRPGIYNTAGGEIFPLQIGTLGKIRGAGGDSTIIIGPGGPVDPGGAVISANGEIISIEGLKIETSNNTGVGIYLVPTGPQVKIKENTIGPCGTGIIADCTTPRRPEIDSNIIRHDSTGITVLGECEPIIRDNQIDSCGLYGIRIEDFAAPDLGSILYNDSTDAGGNTIIECGQWLIYNLSPDTIWALENTWPFTVPSANDPLIYDDDESGGQSGPVILER